MKKKPALDREKPEERLCPCRRRACPRHGSCGECREYHKREGRFPVWCERPEKKREAGT